MRFQTESVEVDCHMSEQSGTESCRENGGSSNGSKEEPVTDDFDDNTGTDDAASPIPGTSKSTGVRRRTSKEPKRSSPDPVEGRDVLTRVRTILVLGYWVLGDIGHIGSYRYWPNIFCG